MMTSHTPLTPFRHSDFPVQSLWIGTLGLLERLSMASFIANGHSYHLYAYDLSLEVPHGVELKDARAILPEQDIYTYTTGAAKGGVSAFADWFRYTLLAIKGGWWADTDVICLKPFDFNTEVVLGYERTRWGGKKICVGVLFAPPAHSLMQACASDAAATNRQHVRFAQNGEPIMRRHVAAQHLTSCIQPPDTFNPINWWRSADIAKPGTVSLLSPSSSAVHCFGESWRWRLRQEYEAQFHNRHFPADSLLGHLQTRYAEAMA